MIQIQPSWQSKPQLYQVDLTDRHQIKQQKPHTSSKHPKDPIPSPRKHTGSSRRGRSLSNYTCFILTSAFIHAPGLGPDFEGIWLFLPRRVRLVGGGRLRGGVVRQHLGAVRGRRRVPAAVARHALLGTVLAVFPFKWLLLKEKGESGKGEGTDGYWSLSGCFPSIFSPFFDQAFLRAR